MKFIRDIINEKKLSGEIGEQPLSGMSLNREPQSCEDEPGELNPLELRSFDTHLLADVAPSDGHVEKPSVDFDPQTLDCDDLDVEEDDAEEQVPEGCDPIGNLFSDPAPDFQISPDPVETEPGIAALAKPESPETAGSDPEEEGASDILSWQSPVAVDVGKSNENHDGFPEAQAIANPDPQIQVPDPVVIPVEVPKPATGRAASRSGRVKTRLLGFTTPDSSAPDPFGKPGEPAAAGFSSFPVGWLVITDGPGRGAAFTLFDGLTQIGRGEGQTVRLNFGDNSISRENHAAIAFDAEQCKFFFGHGGKANLVRLNGRPVLSTEEMPSDSQIRIGETSLRFVALCGDQFTWGTDQQKVAVNDVAG